jgi:hypothetical protein
VGRQIAGQERELFSHDGLAASKSSTRSAWRRGVLIS